MAKMISLKRSPAEKKARDKELRASVGPGQEDYPYESRVSLDHEALERHGLGNGAMPKTGDKFDLGGVKGHVHSVEEHTVDGETRRHMTLQMTHIEHGLGLKSGGSVRDDLEDAAKGVK